MNTVIARTLFSVLSRPPSSTVLATIRAMHKLTWMVVLSDFRFLQQSTLGLNQQLCSLYWCIVCQAMIVFIMAFIPPALLLYWSCPFKPTPKPPSLFRPIVWRKQWRTSRISREQEVWWQDQVETNHNQWL